MKTKKILMLPCTLCLAALLSAQDPSSSGTGQTTSPGTSPSSVGSSSATAPDTSSSTGSDADRSSTAATTSTEPQGSSAATGSTSQSGNSEMNDQTSASTEAKSGTRDDRGSLPATASPLPLLGLLGVGSLLAGLYTRKHARN